MYVFRSLFLSIVIYVCISFMIDELFILLCTSVLYFFKYVCLFGYLVGFLSLCIVRPWYLFISLCMSLCVVCSLLLICLFSSVFL